MKKYEFKFVPWRATDAFSPIDAISELGLQGWQLVSVFQLGEGQAIYHYLQREIVDVINNIEVTGN